MKKVGYIGSAGAEAAMVAAAYSSAKKADSFAFVALPTPMPTFFLRVHTDKSPTGVALGDKPFTTITTELWPVVNSRDSTDVVGWVVRPSKIMFVRKQITVASGTSFVRFERPGTTRPDTSRFRNMGPSTASLDDCVKALRDFGSDPNLPSPHVAAHQRGIQVLEVSGVGLVLSTRNQDVSL